MMLDDYIDSAPPGANEAVELPRYHGATKPSSYLTLVRTPLSMSLCVCARACK